jgi:unsaturated chondroitin disaccharide hydrolase
MKISANKNTIIIIVLIFSCFTATRGQNPERIISDIEKQTNLMLNEISKTQAELKVAKVNGVLPLVSPRSLNASGGLILVASKDWTSGFFPGVLWLLFEMTHDKKWETRARQFTSNIENEKFNGGTHDMGFKIYCSFGNGYRLTGEVSYKEVIIQAAKTLSKRFNPKTGCIRSWDHSRDKWSNPVIIDNMMNLELLFAATNLTSDSSFYQIAVTHANSTMKNHYRPDYSSWHVVDYDSITGNVLKKTTHQGFSNESAWARGQAWGLYGFTMCYRETKDRKYLEQAEKIAGFILNHPNLPEDLIPYWDFNAPGIPNEPRDASAGAIIASALFELGRYSAKGNDYRSVADKILRNLSDRYRSPMNENKGFILLHSTGSKPSKSEVDVPLNYADYYYLEALIRKEKFK